MKDLFYILLLAILAVNVIAFQRTVLPPSITSRASIRPTSTSPSPSLGIIPSTEHALVAPSRSVYQKYSQASDTSFGLSDVVVVPTKTKTFLDYYSFKLLDSFQRRRPLSTTTTRETTTITSVTHLLLQWWYAFPMCLALVPLYCTFWAKTCARMPHWWPMTNMDYIVASSGNGALIIACFLLSNSAYLLSGSYLVQKFPPIQQQHQQGGPSSWRRLAPVPTKYTMLGLWILAAGLVSTIFHFVQALGSFHMAEALCFVDHGVAISACFYYWKTLPRPSRRVWALGLMGGVALVITVPGYYVGWHSTWHFLSAAGATLWAVEGHASQNNIAKQAINQSISRLG
jgi:hypothetical protein